MNKEKLKSNKENTAYKKFFNEKINIRKRYNYFTFLFVIVFSVLVLSSFYTMIIKGKEYREISDTKRIKDIYLAAPRGNIYDRNGKLLAGTKSSFTVQLLADQLTELKGEEKNKQIKTLIRLLEEDGANYIEDLPIDMNVFSYPNKKDYFTEKLLPEDKVVEAIEKNHLMGEFLRYYQKSNDQGGYDFYIANRALSALESKGITCPINIKYQDGQVIGEFIEDDSYKEFLEKHKFTGSENPLDAINSLIADDKTVIRKILNHPTARKLAYDMLGKFNLKDNVTLEDYVISSDKDNLLNKAELSKNFPFISLDSTAKADFIGISETSLSALLVKADTNEKKEVINPAAILIDLIEKKTKSKIGLVSKVDSSGKSIEIEYADKDQATSEKPLDILVRKAKESGVLEEFFTRDDIKFAAQDANTSLAIVPKISVIEWDYIFVKEKADLLEKYKAKKDIGPKELLDKIKEYYKIDSDDDFETLAIISIIRRIEKQGHLSYQPINLAYNIKNKTISKIGEQLDANKGIRISSEPVRYYPEGDTLAHVLGYLGRIAQESEIQKYVKEMKYDPNELIGKTGIEESFEYALRGKSGKRVVEVDSTGNSTKTLKEISPESGDHVYLSTDLELSKVAQAALKQTLEKVREGGSFDSKWGSVQMRTNDAEGRPYYNANSGAVVALDIETGEVLTMINEKSYDPNLFATGISDSDWNSLFPKDDNNPLADRPLLNIAMQTEVQPGSTFKLLSSLAALEKGFSPERQINCMGYIDIGNTRFGCWIWNQLGGMHGPENLYAAIRDSCNYYFYTLALGENPRDGDKLNVKLEYDDIRKYAIKLGLDKPTGIEINVPYESSGKIPDKEEKKDTMKTLLNSFLDKNIELYLQKGKNLNPVTKDAIIKEILKFIDEEDTITRADIDERLQKLSIDTEKVLEGGSENIVDIIKYTYIDHSGWDKTDMLNVVIGQGQNAYTPLQMANYASVFANGGYRNKLSLIKEVQSSDGSTVLLKNEPERTKIELNNPDNLKYIAKGMNMASHSGSLDLTFGPFPVEIAIKTGTAERGGINPATGKKFDDYSWMIAFAPYDNPKIAVAAILYQGGSGANCSAIVREVIGEYLKLDKTKQNPNPTNEIRESD